MIGTIGKLTLSFVNLNKSITKIFNTFFVEPKTMMTMKKIIINLDIIFFQIWNFIAQEHCQINVLDKM